LFFLFPVWFSLPGLRFEDLIVEADDVGKAFTRIPKEVLSGMFPSDLFYHCTFILPCHFRLDFAHGLDHDDRIKEAMVLMAAGKILPKERWTTKETDVPYLAPYLAQA
jgi:hypothetical protein